MRTPSKKWVILKDQSTLIWLARVPYGSYRWFYSWEEAAQWLQWKYEKRGRR